MANEYHYLVAGLPDLVQDAKKQPIALQDFISDLEQQLAPNDLQLSRMIFLQFDNQNLINLLLKNNKPFMEMANYSLEEMEQNIKEPTSLEPYLNDFILAFKSETPIFSDLSWEDNLSALYFEHLKKVQNPFLRGWFQFDYSIRNIRTAVTVRKHKLNPANYILDNSDFSQALKKSTLRDFGLSNEYPFMEKLLSILDTEYGLQVELVLDRMRWDYLDELNTFIYFSVEVVIAFIIKLMMIERWIALDAEVGQQMFDQILKDLKSSYEFSKEFSINERRKESN